MKLYAFKLYNKFDLLLNSDFCNFTKSKIEVIDTTTTAVNGSVSHKPIFNTSKPVSLKSFPYGDPIVLISSHPPNYIHSETSSPLSNRDFCRNSSYIYPSEPLRSTFHPVPTSGPLSSYVSWSSPPPWSSPLPLPNLPVLVASFILISSTPSSCKVCHTPDLIGFFGYSES